MAKRINSARTFARPDLGMFMAGPYCGAILADMGAEVIKIESCRRPDPLRIQARGLYSGGIPGEHPWNRSGMINDRNRNKYGITLDLTMPRGKEIFHKLVAISDVALENFSRRVVKTLGLEYATLKAIKPDIILASLSSQGNTGPQKDNVSFGPTLEQIGGMAYLTGYPDEMSAFTSYAYPDALAGMMGVGIILAALRYRQRTGLGLQIDLSQRELTTNCIGEAMMDYAMNRRVVKAMGNRHTSMAPYGCYPCKGDDKWVAIAIGNDLEFQRLCGIIGRPDLSRNEKYADAVSRWKNQNELDVVIAEWTKTRDHCDVMNMLQKEGLMAGAVLAADEIFTDPHIRAREFLLPEPHPEAGTQVYKGKPIKLSRTPLRRELPAPCLGEHNTYVFGTLLGMSKTEIDDLEKEGVTGTVPKPRIFSSRKNVYTIT